MARIAMAYDAPESIVCDALGERETSPARSLGQFASRPRHISSIHRRRIEKPHCHHTP
jgi:hypothetical protein